MTDTTDNFYVQAHAMRGSSCASAGIRLCEEAERLGRPLTTMESADLRLREIELFTFKNKLRTAKRDAKQASSLWERIDSASSSKPKLRVENAHDGVKLYLYGPIGAGFGGVDAESFARELDNLRGETVKLHLNSEGGSLIDGISIFNSIRSHGRVDVVVDSLAASAGSVIAQGGRTIAMNEHSWMMIHSVSGTVAGDPTDLRSAADQFDRFNDQLVEIYSERWKGSKEALREAIIQETWLDANQAVNSGLADYISYAASVAARFTPSQWGYTNTPSILTVAAHHKCVSPAMWRMKLRLAQMEFTDELD